MGMAQEQDIPIKTEAPTQWSMRRLFPFAAVSNAFAKTFINVFDVLLGFSIFIIGIAEILNRDVSWVFYIVSITILVASLYERHEVRLVEQAQHKEKSKDK